MKDNSRQGELDLENKLAGRDAYFRLATELF